jgi:hypothetical protein
MGRHPSLESPLLDPLLEFSSFDPPWNLFHTTFPRVFIRPSLESPLLDPLLESSSMIQSESSCLITVNKVLVKRIISN